jgi:hypothetical protein
MDQLLQDVQTAIANASSPSSDPAAHGRLLQAIHKLTLAVETPTETNMRILYQPVQNASVRMAIEMGLPHAIVARDGKPVSAGELAEEVKADPLLVGTMFSWTAYTVPDSSKSLRARVLT